MLIAKSYLVVGLVLILLIAFVIWFYVGLETPKPNNFVRNTSTTTKVVDKTASTTTGNNDSNIVAAGAIIGVWKASGNNGAGLSWYLNYTFTKDAYTIEGYPTLLEVGKYTIVKEEKFSDGTVVTLNLVSANETKPRELKVKLLTSGGLIINNETYAKQ